MYQEELSLLKRQNISRSLSFRAAIVGNSKDEDLDVSMMEDLHGTDQLHVDELNNIESCQCVRVSTKQVNRQQLLFSRIIQLRLENVHDQVLSFVSCGKVISVRENSELTLLLSSVNCNFNLGL